MVLYSDTFQMGNWSHIHIIWDYFHQARSYLQITGFILPDSYMYVFITANWTQIWKSGAPYTKENSLKVQVLNCLSETVSRHYKHVPKKANLVDALKSILTSNNVSFNYFVICSGQNRCFVCFECFSPSGQTTKHRVVKRTYSESCFLSSVQKTNYNENNYN